MLLKMEKICKDFSGVKALKNVNFQLEKGEIHSLLGENGAGKSTLIKILGGVYTATSGEIYLDNKKVNFKNPIDSQKQGIAIIHQELMLAENLSIAENIFLGKKIGTIFNTNIKEMIQKSKKYLNMLGLDIDPSEKVKNLNVSEKQLVEIAKALSYNSKIIVMDEPTATITEHEVEKLFKIMKNLKKEGISIIFITHRMDEVYEISDKVTVLRDGEFIGSGELKNYEKDTLIKMMVGREVKEMYPKFNKIKDETIFELKNFEVENHVKPLSFTIKKGEIFGITGLVGCGKSELAMGLFGMMKNKFEKMTIKSKEIKQLKSPLDALKNGIIIIPEERKSQGIIPGLDITKNIILPNIKNFGPSHSINWKKAEKTAQEEIQKFSIKTPNQKQILKKLSGGNQQKVVISKYLMKQPELALFVEPTRGIDVGAKIEVYNLINQLANDGIVVILISSEIPEIVGLCDRTMVMHRGKISKIINSKDMDPEKILKAGTGLTENDEK
jgi:ribose transport system ATP-binding protein